MDGCRADRSIGNLFFSDKSQSTISGLYLAYIEDLGRLAQSRPWRCSDVAIKVGVGEAVQTRSSGGDEGDGASRRLPRAL